MPVYLFHVFVRPPRVFTFDSSAAPERTRICSRRGRLGIITYEYSVNARVFGRHWPCGKYHACRRAARPLSSKTERFRVFGMGKMGRAKSRKSRLFFPSENIVATRRRWATHPTVCTARRTARPPGCCARGCAPVALHRGAPASFSLWISPRRGGRTMSRTSGAFRVACALGIFRARRWWTWGGWHSVRDRHNCVVVSSMNRPSLERVFFTTKLFARHGGEAYRDASPRFAARSIVPPEVSRHRHRRCSWTLASRLLVSRLHVAGSHRAQSWSRSNHHPRLRSL